MWYSKIISSFLIASLGGFICAQAQAPFITTWQTDMPGVSDDFSISIPLVNSSYYAFTIDWGDGIDEQYIGMGSELEVTHTYSSQGVYFVQIEGVFPRIRFTLDSGDRQKILSVEQWGDISWQSFESAFHSCSNLHVWATDVPDLTNVTNLNGMFAYASVMNESLNNWDVSNVTDMGFVFSHAVAFNQPLDDWDVSSVTNMWGMFSHASSFNQPLATWDVSNVTNMVSMFHGASTFNQPLNSWQVGNVTQLFGMFQDALSFNQPLDNWDVSGVNSVLGLSQMFTGASSFNQPLNTWDVSNVLNMENMFRWASSFNQPLDNWDVTGVTGFFGMMRMFEGATAFDQSLGSWQVSNVQTMIGMFDESGMSYCNYDATLLGWSEAPVQMFVQLGASGLQYSDVGLAGRQALINNFNWMISGDEWVDVPDFVVTYEVSGPQITVTPIGGTGNYTFTWSGPDDFSSNDSSVVAPTNGQYLVVVSDGCHEWSQSFDIVTVNVSSYSADPFQPFPNPSIGLFRVTKQDSDWQEIRVFDISGRLVNESTFNSSADVIDLQHLAPGTYMCIALNSRNVSVGTARIVIVR